MNFMQVAVVAVITFFITSPIIFLLYALIFSIGLRNREEDAYRLGCKHGSASVEKLKEIGICHDYHNEREDIVQWIDKVNDVIKGLW